MAEIEIFAGPGCSDCRAAKRLLAGRGLAFTEHDVSDQETLAELRARLPRARVLPQIFIDGAHLGGLEDLRLGLARGAIAGSDG